MQRVERGSHVEAILYLFKMTGSKEYFGIDINPERMSSIKAIEINRRATMQK